MGHTPHELSEQFPNHADAIHALKQSNPHFARLTDDYHELNRQIHRAETDVEPTDDFHLEEMKKKRLLLLDQVREMLTTKV
jgi:uncharacterized protein YdcH (DUF465 family)